MFSAEGEPSPLPLRLAYCTCCGSIGRLLAVPLSVAASRLACLRFTNLICWLLCVRRCEDDHVAWDGAATCIRCTEPSGGLVFLALVFSALGVAVLRLLSQNSPSDTKARAACCSSPAWSARVLLVALPTGGAGLGVAGLLTGAWCGLTA